ncbi:MAG: lipid-binding SYLF domain-containing protein [Thermodesulfobacteriota bacterium]
MNGGSLVLTRKGGPMPILVVAVIGLMVVLFFCFVPVCYGATAKEIEANVDAALKLFTQVKGGKELLQKAKGILVLPGVFKAGLVVGGEYGEGALRIGGKTVNYYSIAAGSFGLQIGAQKKNIIICFMEENALKTFRASAGWKVGADGSVAVLNVGAGVSIDSTQIENPIVSVIFGQKGLMANATIEGAKLTKIVR